VQLSPRYDGPVVLAIEGSVEDPALAVTRQRRRMERLLAGLSAEQWAASTRCEAWSARDVIAHLVTVNQFWEASVRAGRDGNPTRILATFDPAAHPDLLVASMGPIGPEEVFEQFVASNDGFLGVVADLADDEWALVAESPLGHVPLGRVIDHALWDAWIHERDIALPAGLPVDEEPDELAACLRYAASAGAAMDAGRPGSFTGTLAVASTDPVVEIVVDAGTTVTLRDGTADPSVPVLTGRTADLVDALSLRAPLPESTPPEWHHMVQGLTTAFTPPPAPTS
jgi:uncharacterized protein (TIGR03083 family)